MERRVGLMKGVGLWVGELGKWMSESGFGDVREWEAEEWEELARAFFDSHLAKDREMVEEKGGEEGEERLRGCLRSRGVGRWFVRRRLFEWGGRVGGVVRW